MHENDRPEPAAPSGYLSISKMLANPKKPFTTFDGGRQVSGEEAKALREGKERRREADEGFRPSR